MLCFHLQLDLISAAAKAGGIQGLMITFMYGFVTAHIWLKRKIARIPHKKWKCIVAFLVLLPLLLEVASFLAVVTLIGKRSTIISGYGNYVLLIVVLSALAFITALFPLWLHFVKTGELEFDATSINSTSDTDESDAEDESNDMEHKELLQSGV